jgi:hypothetical protein
MLDHYIPSFFDEMQKIAVTTSLSTFPQIRSGRRPIRVHNMLKKDQQVSLADRPDDAEERYKTPDKTVEYEGGSGMDANMGNYMGGA